MINKQVIFYKIYLSRPHDCVQNKNMYLLNAF